MAAPSLPAAPSLIAPLLRVQGAINFALFSANAWGVTLCLFTEVDLVAGRITYEVELDSDANRTGGVWHTTLPDLDPSLLYGYKVHGPETSSEPAQAGHGFDLVSALPHPASVCQKHCALCTL